MRKTIIRTAIILMAIVINVSGCTGQTVVKDMVDQNLSNHPMTEPTELRSDQQAAVPGSEPADTSTRSWYTVRNKEHKVPEIDHTIGFSLSKYQAYYIGSKEKIIFLTFDEGYENGYTSKILDVLKANHVPAAFFVTEPYIQANPELVTRMAAEGHIVANHSKTHPSMPSLCGDAEAFNKELTTTSKAYKELTGKEMPLFFRPPRGEYSEKSLQLTAALGYKTIFWSFAYEDWLVDRQPPEDASYQKIMQSTHNGEIMLLHAVSSTNASILDQLLKDMKKEGYHFSSLTEISLK